MAKVKQSAILLVVLLVIGLLLGSILGDILSKLGVPYIFESTQIRWSPSGDFSILVWDINILLRINLASVLGLALVFYIYRKL
ncbi:DUF4321 domain-containing protein [Candidatus Contubernalis alkaliaceticus]|uniref:DUF4321 domain-containing protein n=1 Tax=Candidatus Contubernalis alkaliaceticus TaxID=338645 RepID=UPI001F4C1CC2|nr:DUF4321 domain-containing protein [Candidatus Contubernalis alkalaceticus]UNC90998.1 DUF4321 domain-containing protein [Candidatus Contubernalis alkalaceticus]